MKVLIIGAGAVGVATAVSLKSEGIDTYLFARNETADYIRKKGAKRTGIFGDIFLSKDELPVVDSYETAGENYDAVIISAKTLANNEIAKELSNHPEILGSSGKIILFQNGWGNEDAYMKFLPKDRIFHARIITGFEKTEFGISKVTVHTAPILLGSLFGEDFAWMEPIAKALSSSGIPSEVTNQVAEALWAKMLFNTTLNPLGAILNLSYGKMSEITYARDIMNRLINETYAVMEAEVYRTFWDSPEEYKEAFYGKLVPDTYEHRSSTLQDLEKGHKTEIDTLNGCICRIAGNHEIAVPTHEMICLLIRSIEEKNKIF